MSWFILHLFHRSEHRVVDPARQPVDEESDGVLCKRIGNRG
jgi:hypothetical protein